ncbi:MAG: hypothetical protein WCC63_00190 [Candidatus Bathyarchaeia archaeon]
MNSLSSKIAITVITGIAWLAFVILFLAFYAGNFDIWQNIAILLVSALIALGMVAVAWIRMIPA